jgi:hypothetical protein
VRFKKQQDINILAEEMACLAALIRSFLPEKATVCFYGTNHCIKADLISFFFFFTLATVLYSWWS